MSSLKSLFSAANFKSTVKNYCQQIGWKIADIDDKHATLIFTMDSGRDQRLFLIRYEETIEFSVPSLIQIADEDDIPHQISTVLLKRNASKIYGFWAIEEINKKYTFSIMHNAQLELMNVDFFAAVVRSLISECDEFEDMLLKD